jgi:hypothetical protein
VPLTTGMIVPLTKVIVVASPRITAATSSGCPIRLSGLRANLSVLPAGGWAIRRHDRAAGVRSDEWWHWHRFGAEALARQGAWDAAIAYADGCRTAQGYDDRQIDRFCEDVLIKFGRADDAYLRYGLKTATGPTYLAIFRDTVKRYPNRDRRQVLLDLIETRGKRGKWFAAAKSDVRSRARLGLSGSSG